MTENKNSAPVAITPRGFPIWADFVDDHGVTVIVVSSSAATDDYVWVQADESLHLDVEQATILRDALTAWISSVTP